MSAAGVFIVGFYNRVTHTHARAVTVIIYRYPVYQLNRIIIRTGRPGEYIPKRYIIIIIIRTAAAAAMILLYSYYNNIKTLAPAAVKRRRRIMRRAGGTKPNEVQTGD